MPSLAITPAQRKILYEGILDHLSGIGDLPMVLETGDQARAERLSREFHDDLTLLIEDLGVGDRRDEPVVVNSDPVVVRRVLHRLRSEAERAERAETGERVAVIEEAAHHASLRETCSSLLGELG